MHLLIPLSDALLLALTHTHPPGPATPNVHGLHFRLMLELDLSLHCELGHRLKLEVILFIFQTGTIIVCTSLGSAEHLCEVPTWCLAHRKKPRKVRFCAVLLFLHPSWLLLLSIIPSWIKKVLSWMPVRQGRGNLTHSKI